MNSAIGYRQADVVVAGGGPGGAIAAIAAARNGASVLLVEQLGFPGGMFSGGNMSVAAPRPWSGIGDEIFDRLEAMGATRRHPDDQLNAPIFHFGGGASGAWPYDPEMVKIVLFELLEQAGVKLLLHTFVTGAVAEGKAVRGVTLANKSGTEVAIGKVVIDGTGDGDVAASAGAPFLKGLGDDKRLLAMTQLVRLSNVDWDRAGEYSRTDPGWKNAIAAAQSAGELPYYKPRSQEMTPYWGHARPELAHLWREDGALLWGGTVENADGTDADSLSDAEAECRRQWVVELAFLRKRIPGFEHARVEDSGATIGVRDTRHILGDYVYTGYDIMARREFPDAVAYNTQLYLGVPYRSLVPQKVDNLLIAARCISAEPGHTRSGSIMGAANDMKSIATVMNYGQAAGTAAALCVKTGVTPRQVDVPALQRLLLEQGALLSPQEFTQRLERISPVTGKTQRETLEARRRTLQEYWERHGYRFDGAAG